MLNGTIRWPSMREVLKNDLMLVQQLFYVFFIVGSNDKISLNGYLSLNITFDLFMFQDRSHVVGRYQLLWVGVHSTQNNLFPIKKFDLHF